MTPMHLTRVYGHLHIGETWLRSRYIVWHNLSTLLVGEILMWLHSWYGKNIPRNVVGRENCSDSLNCSMNVVTLQVGVWEIVF